MTPPPEPRFQTADQPERETTTWTRYRHGAGTSQSWFERNGRRGTQPPERTGRAEGGSSQSGRQTRLLRCRCCCGSGCRCGCRPNRTRPPRMSRLHMRSWEPWDSDRGRGEGRGRPTRNPATGERAHQQILCVRLPGTDASQRMHPELR